MSDIFYIKRGDTSPSIGRTLLDGSGQPLDLTGAVVVFNMGDYRGVRIARQPCILTGAQGVVHYGWQPEDTAIEGTFSAEFEITYPGGAVETVPNNAFLSVKITKDIA